MWNGETPGCSTDVTEQRRDEGQISSTSESNSVNEIPSTSQLNSVVLPQQNQGVNIDRSTNEKIDHREDNRTYTQTINNQVMKVEITDIEKVTMVSVIQHEEGRDVPKTVRITPTHQSFQEYSAAQFIANEMDVESFTKLVDDQLFNPDVQDQWNMVRRFVAGILANVRPTPERSSMFSGLFKLFFKNSLIEKKNYFMKAYIGTLKKMLSTSFFFNVTGDKRRNLEELQSSMNLDLMEMPNEIDSIKSSLTSVRHITFETRPKDVTMMEGTNFFLSQLDPHIGNLKIYLPSNCDLHSFNRMTSSIGKLTKKIGWLWIENINLPSTHIDQILQLIDKTDDYFFLQYTNATKDDEIRSIMSHLQTYVDSKSTMDMHIQLNHKWRDYIIRQQPDMTSSSNNLIKQAKMDKICKEIDLRLLTSSSILQSIIGLEEWKKYWFHFTICNKMEIRTFTQLMNKVKIHVNRIILCLPEDVGNDDLELFCQTIAEHDIEIWFTSIKNIVWSDFYFDQICKILPNVERIQIDIMEEINDDEKEKIMKKFQPHVRKSCRLDIAFMDDHQIIWGD